MNKFVEHKIGDIPDFETFVKIEPINEGLSKDKKFYVESADGKQLLLRVSDISEHDRQKAVYNRMKQMASHEIPMPTPVDFGLCNDGKNVYQFWTWCKGENFEAVLPALTETEQYITGLRAGEILRKIHSVPIIDEDKTKEDWNGRYSNFIDESIKDFHKCGVKADGSDVILDYFNANRNLLKNRPQCYLHGDYHTSNMIYNNGELTIIDWEIHLYNNYGDPWIELAMQKTPKHFSTGVIQGYFEGEPPNEYWRALAFYQSIRAISSIPWAYYQQPGFLESLIERVAEVVTWYDNMNNTVPTWYLKDFYI